jgi:hypothetical protein
LGRGVAAYASSLLSPVAIPKTENIPGQQRRYNTLDKQCPLSGFWVARQMDTQQLVLKPVRRVYRSARRAGSRLKRRLKGHPPRHRFPWYDSRWLASYVESKAYLARRHPDKLEQFERALSVFRTDPAFEPVKLDQFFDEDVLGRIRQRASGLTPGQVKHHELVRFGRHVVHDDPLNLELQHEIVDRVSEVVGEALEVSYNFLSLYTEFGVCALHLDAPFAKWTLDLRIEQSREWPIYLSEVVDWPESPPTANTDDWADVVKKSATFKAHTMSPGQAIVFGGSSQWHYRDRMPNATTDDFCTLLFFHFIPAGKKRLVNPANWADIFGVPDLRNIVH